MTYEHFKSLFLPVIQRYTKQGFVNPDATGFTLEEWEGYPVSLVHIQEYDGWVLQLQIGLDTDPSSPADEMKQFLLDIEENHFELIKPLKDLLFAMFTELTNNDPCSYSAIFDTAHASWYGDYPCHSGWTLTIKITDYLS